MKEIKHPFIKYGIALVLRENNLSKTNDINNKQIVGEIKNSMNHFRLKPIGNITDKKEVTFIFCDEEKGNPNIGIYLAPNVLTTDKSAKDVFSSSKKLIIELLKEKDLNIDITRGISPVSGEFSRFGESAIGRGKPKTSIQEAGFSFITTVSEKKPCLAFKSFSKGKVNSENVAIIPDLSIENLIDFINLFERVKTSSTHELYKGFITDKDNKPQRPRIYNGNFPHAPRSSSLGAIALLGALGSWAKEAEDIKWTKGVLDTLKEVPIYMVGTNIFDVFKYNHFIIELAKENKLGSIVDSVYYTVLYNQGRRNSGNRIEYQKFDLFTARFLQVFTVPTFKDFLAFRAEYPYQFEILLNKYFINMEKITTEVVKSARELGKWLNYAAYKVADISVEEKSPDRDNKVRDQKAKNLIEIESAIFSARDGAALIFSAITRAGRASGLDAPAEAELFMTEASTGAISLESAKHLLIAFSRVRNKYEPKDKVETENEDENDGNASEDLSDAQE